MAFLKLRFVVCVLFLYLIKQGQDFSGSPRLEKKILCSEDVVLRSSKIFTFTSRVLSLPYKGPRRPINFGEEYTAPANVS